MIMDQQSEPRPRRRQPPCQTPTLSATAMIDECVSYLSIYLSIYLSYVWFHCINCFSYSYIITRVCSLLSTVLYHQQCRRHVLYQDHCHHSNVVLLSKILKTFKCLTFKALLLKATPGRNISTTIQQEHSSTSSGTRNGNREMGSRISKQHLFINMDVRTNEERKSIQAMQRGKYVRTMEKGRRACWW